MRIQVPALEGRLQKRYKRFLADVELEDGSVVTAHCPNTGSLLGCKEPGSKVLLRDSENDKRKLRYTWQAIQVGRVWVNVDTGLPNALVLEAAQNASIPEFEGWDGVRREVKYGKNSRIDVLLEKDSGEKLYVEVKNTTLAEGRVGLFPDAVTERGKKHLEELMDVVADGQRAAMFFVVSRSDVDTFRPADDIDPAYGETLRRAVKAGVEIIAYSTKVTKRTFELAERLVLDLSAPASHASA